MASVTVGHCQGEGVVVAVGEIESDEDDGTIVVGISITVAIGY